MRIGDPRKDVEVSGGQGIVIGDYATVFQGFNDSPASIGSYIRSAQFRALIEERRKGFVGRTLVFEAIDSVIAGDNFPSGYVLIRGEPGIGKTALASVMTVREGYVHHFNIAQENICSARQFL
jgi:DNA helicase TIP49 (TBP-interacting protein)